MKPAQNRQLSTRFKLLAATITLVLFALVTECALRLIDPDLFYQNQTFPLNRDVDFPDVYKRDTDIFWRFYANQTIDSRRFSYLDYRINSQGRRGPETPEDDGSFRILALGNSCTFGWGVKYDNIWTTQLQRVLRERFPQENIQVINAGIPGYSSHQGKLYFSRELVSLDCDMVLTMFGWNDQFAAGSGIGDDEQQMSGPMILCIQNALAKTKLYQLLRKVVLAVSESRSDVQLDDNKRRRRVPLDRFSDNLREIISAVRKSGATPVLLLPPVASLDGYFEGTVSDFHQRHVTYQQKMINVSQYTGTPLVDLQTAFDLHTNLFDNAQSDPIHFNQLGHQVAADAIADTISSLLRTK